MKKRKLGNSDLSVNPVGLGCMGFSHASGAPTDNETAIKTIRQAYEMGYDFLIQQRHIQEYSRMVLFPITRNSSGRLCMV